MILQASERGAKITRRLLAVSRRASLEAAPMDAAAPRGRSADPIAGSFRLLVVDDEAAVRETVTEQLRAVGYGVDCAEGGAEALAIFDAGHAHHLVISDLSMPTMDGVALLREIRRRRPGAPSILLTGFPSESTGLTVGAALGGGVILLRKPVTGAQLTEAVAGLLRTAGSPDLDREAHLASETSVTTERNAP
jgi:CheY-like chemotaxis protein